MKSMTGFGRAAADCPEFSLTVDVSSVNKKGLELSVGLPREWQPMERLVAAKLREFYTRGKVGVSIKAEFKGIKNSPLADKAAVAAALEELKSLCSNYGTKFEPTADTILKICELTSSCTAQNSDWEAAWETVATALDQALRSAEQMRELEGENLKKDLIHRLDLILELVMAAEKESKNTVGQYRDQLLGRLKEMGLEIRLDDERLLKELCIFADKCDVAEEITRLKSHISQFIAAADESGPVGRKMDFICQEMGREINTTASKANNLELTKLAISLKNELERVREQVQNVE